MSDRLIDRIRAGEWYSVNSRTSLIAEFDAIEQELTGTKGALQNYIEESRRQDIEILTLKEQLGIVENACQDWRERAESAEAERDSLNTLVDTQKKCYDIAIKKLESAERIADDVGKTCDYWQKCAKEAEDEVKRLQVKANELDGLKDPMKPFGVTGDFGQAIQEHLKFEEAKARLAKAQALIDSFKQRGVCKIDNANNGGLCVGEHCYCEWATCEERKIVSLTKYFIDVNIDEKALKGASE